MGANRAKYLGDVAVLVDLAVDPPGDLLLAGNPVRKLTPAGALTTVAGGGDPPDGLSGTAARRSPHGCPILQA